jgi:hypothetical protein
LTPQSPSKTTETTPRNWGTEKAPWLRLLWLPVIAVLLAVTGFAVHYYRATQEFDVTGEVLYKNETKVRPVEGTRVLVYEDKGKPFPRNNRYSLLMEREVYLWMSPEIRDPTKDIDLVPLNLAPLTKMDWTWWEIERLHNCSWAGRLFKEALQSPAVVATTSTDMSGRFWLKLRRGKYFITAEGEVPTFWRIEDDPGHPDDTSRPVTGDAFWRISVTVTGTMKVVSADPSCSPTP